jgi:ubiquinone/menaquinone biosynthesis C-methylase UbiE
MTRNRIQKIKDGLTFPVRVFHLFEEDWHGLSSLRTERFDYAAEYVVGYCLDVGCGKHNLFIAKHLKGNGKGVDVYPFIGLTKEHLIEDFSHLPFPDATFDSVTFIGNIGHVPVDRRDIELREAYRCLRNGGNIVMTMGNPFCEKVIHRVVNWHDKLLGTDYDMDTERGMEEGESYFVRDHEVRQRLKDARFVDVKRHTFWTQWGLNHLFVGWKRE